MHHFMTVGAFLKEVCFWLGFWPRCELEKVEAWENIVSFFWALGKNMKHMENVRKNEWFKV